jgi:hypothetical protein
MINKALDLPFPEPEETYSTSDYLYEELEIPKTATGRLPRAKRTRAGLEAEEIEDLGETGRRRPASGGAPSGDRGGRPPRGGQRSRSGGQGSRNGGQGSGSRQSQSGQGGQSAGHREPKAEGAEPSGTPRKPRQRRRRRLNAADGAGGGTGTPPQTESS